MMPVRCWQRRTAPTGDWKRFRPLLWPVNDATATDSPVRRPGLAGAVCEADPASRAERLDTALAALADGPDHPDWAVLRGYVRLAKDIAPTSLDPLQRLIRHPDTLALAVLMADDDGFDGLIRLADQMPFAWWLMPVRSWRRAAVGYFAHLRAGALGHGWIRGALLGCVCRVPRARHWQ
jgi:hypothetical protein